MKNEIFQLFTEDRINYTKEEAHAIADSFVEMNEKEVGKALNQLEYHLGKMTVDVMVEMRPAALEEISSFLRIISQKLRHECRKEGAWRYYLYGRYDSAQERLLKDLMKKNEEIQIESILARKNVKDILRILYRNGCIQQNALAEELNLGVPNLSRLMDDLIEANLVEKKKGTKFVFYDLSQKGYMLYNQYCHAVARLEPDEFLEKRKRGLTQVNIISYVSETQDKIDKFSLEKKEEKNFLDVLQAALPTETIEEKFSYVKGIGSSNELQKSRKNILMEKFEKDKCDKSFHREIRAVDEELRFV